jgi:hypothetical protein
MKVGDIFEIKSEGDCLIYLQFLGSDPEQLQSDVVRVFKQISCCGPVPVPDLASLEVHFHAHVLLKIGIRNRVWRSIGRAPVVGNKDVLFRISGDYGNPAVKISQDWWVWRFGSDMEHVGRLQGKWRDAEIGIVVTPEDVRERAVTGLYSFFHPGFD